jgi:tetratricopeptide (TPR) repeat protein
MPDVLSQEGELDAAIDGCRKVLELSPNSPGPHTTLARVYQKQGRHEEAIAEYQKAVELSGRSITLVGRTLDGRWKICFTCCHRSGVISVGSTYSKLISQMSASVVNRLK